MMNSRWSDTARSRCRQAASAVRWLDTVWDGPTGPTPDLQNSKDQQRGQRRSRLLRHGNLDHTDTEQASSSVSLIDRVGDEPQVRGGRSSVERAAATAQTSSFLKPGPSSAANETEVRTKRTPCGKNAEPSTRAGIEAIRRHSASMRSTGGSAEGCRVGGRRCADLLRHRGDSSQASEVRNCGRTGLPSG